MSDAEEDGNVYHLTPTGDDETDGVYFPIAHICDTRAQKKCKNTKSRTFRE